MKIIQSALLAFMLSITGCASMFSAKTDVEYQISPDGTRLIKYSSGKDQTGIDASWEEMPDGKAKTVRLKVDKSSTAESAIAAALQLQLEAMKLLEALAPIAAQAGKAAGPLK